MSNIFNQLVINSLVDSADVQNEIKKYLFHTEEQIIAKNRSIKDKMVNDIKLNLLCQRGPGNDWAVSYRRNKWVMGGQNCRRCGQYYWTNEYPGDEELQNNEELPNNIACKCR